MSFGEWAKEHELLYKSGTNQHLTEAKNTKINIQTPTNSTNFVDNHLKALFPQTLCT